MISMRDNRDIACYLITKHSWKGRYKRVFSVGTVGLSTYNPGGMEITNQWPYSEIVSVTPVFKGQLNNEFLIAIKRGKKVDQMRFSSDHRAEIITAALRFREKFAETPSQPMTFNACKHHWSENKLPVILEIGQVSLQQKHSKSNHLLASYEFKDMEALIPVSDAPGGFVLVHGGFGRMHLFSVNKRDEVMKKISEQAWNSVGVNIKISNETIPFETFENNRLGKFSSDEYITSITEFSVHKLTIRQQEPVKRLLGLTECCLIERDPNSYSIVTLKPLAEVSALIRSSENPQLFCIEYVKGQIRQYTSTERDALLASLLDGVRASGNRDVHVQMLSTERGKRLGPATVPVDEEVESWHLKYLQQAPAGWDFVESVIRFNNNVAYSGLLHSVTQDGLFSEKKEKLIEGAMLALMDKEGDQDSMDLYALEAQFQALRRLVASKIGFGSFLQLPKFRERLGLKVVKALKRNDDGVTHAAVDMICALMQPMHDDYDLRQEQMNKSSLLSSKHFLESLLAMFVQHVKQGTGALVVAAMLDFFTFALCVPYSETTDGSHFDMLLNLVADHGRSLFQLFQHPSLAIVKGAGLVMKAVIEEGESEVASRMQDLALAEGALPRHLHLAMFVQSTDSRLLAMQQLSRQLVSLWVTGHATAMALLKRTLPPGLLSFLDSVEPVPVKSRDLINIRDNLKLAQDHSQKQLRNRRVVPSLKVVEKHLELALEHWRARMGLHKRENEKNSQRPVVLRKRRERIKSECNWAMFYYQFEIDHTKPNLIWNYKTREELRDALESEMRGFTNDRELSQTVVIAWNHTEFEVPYNCLSEEIKIGDYYLRLLLEEDEIEKNQTSYIRRSYEFFNDLYHRFLLTSNGSMRAMCLQAMAIVYGRHHEDIGPFNDTRYVIGMLEKSSDRLERDRLLFFISKLLLNKRNVKDFIEANGVRALVDLLTLAHLHTSRAMVPLQSNVIEASPDVKLDSEKEWHYGNAEKERKGPCSFSELKELYSEGGITRKTRCWAQGMDGWRNMHLVSQLKWMMMSSGNPLMNESELASHVLSMLISICQFYPSRDSHGSIVRPLPKAKRVLCETTCLPHLVQLLLTFDPNLVEQVATLLSLVMQDNPSMPKLYLTGFFFFILMYTGSNVLPIGKLLQGTHIQQAFRSEDSQASSIIYRSILGQLLPEAMVCYLENHGPEKFSEIFLGDFDTPEAIWNCEMRRMMIEKIAAHIADFTPRLKSNTRALYQYCPIPMILYPQLENELFCNIYYLRHLCDTLRFPNWPIKDPVQLLRDVLEAWKQEIEKKPPPISLDEAYKSLGLNIEDRCDEATIRKAYFRLAQKYHPDKNPDGREIFEKVNKAYEFLCSRTSRSCDGPDPQNIILILKTQAILFSRYKEDLHPYKYAGYPMLIKTIAMETEDELLFSKPAPLLPTATETAFHTVNCSALNAEELRREGGLQLLTDAFSRCVGVLNRSSHADDIAVQVASNVSRAFTVAAQFPACRERLTEMQGLIKDLCRLLFYQHLSKLCVIGVECVSALALDEILQTQLFQAGVFFHLLLFLFNYDYTLEEGGVERSQESNQQEVNNQLAKLSVRACIRLSGFPGSDTPENRPIQGALRVLLSPFICRKMEQLPEIEILKLLNCNSENPYFLWNNGTRAELTEYLKTQQQDMIRSGECDRSFGADFTYSQFVKELIIGEIFVRVYNDQPTYTLENPRGFTLELLDYLGSQAQYLYSLMSLKDSGVKVDHNEGRLSEIEMALEALRNVIHNNPGVEMQCMGHFKLLFSLLRLDGCTRVQELAVGVISGVTGNQECVTDIAASDVLVYLLLVLKSLPSSLSQVVVLETMVPLMSNSKLVKEAMSRGAVLYLLDLFCNSRNGDLRELTAELLAKMSSDKLVGPKIRITLNAFLPQLFLDAMKDSPQAAVLMFEVTQENPELIWNDDARRGLSITVLDLAESHYKVQKDNPTVTWKVPEAGVLQGPACMQGEVVVGGVYLRLFIQNPAWVLRRPKDFLIELLDKAHELMTSSNSQQGEFLELVSTALSQLLQAQPALLEYVPVLGHIPRLVQTFGQEEPASSSDATLCGRAWLLIFHQLACNQGCVKCLCRTSFFSAMIKAMQAKPEMMTVACETLHRIFEMPLDELIQQALEVQLVDFLLGLLESRLESITNPSSAKAQLVNALKAMAQSPAWGQQVAAILNKSNVWAEYRDQKHDLFLSPTNTSGYLTGSAQVAGYLTEGPGQYMPSSPPPMEDS